MKCLVRYHCLAAADPVFGFNPLAYNEVEADMDFQVMIVEVNGLTFAPGVSRTLTINSGPGNALSATGESASYAMRGSFQTFYMIYHRNACMHRSHSYCDLKKTLRVPLFLNHMLIV